MIITEEPMKNTEKILPKVILVKPIKLNAQDETYIDITDGGNAIIIKPEFKIHIHFKPVQITPFVPFKYSTDIKIYDETILQFPRDNIDEDRAIIKRFKFFTTFL